jgi:DNA invertase Pin-like site-specific DNA recombinase
MMVTFLEGRARAKANGKHLGRPFKLTPHQQKEAIRRRDSGTETLAEIGRAYNVSAATIRGWRCDNAYRV